MSVETMPPGRFGEHAAARTAGAAPLVVLDRVSKAYVLPNGTRFAAVQDVSLAIAAGDIVGLVGKSGAGKSTLLRLVNLLERPDSGSVRVGGETLTSLDKQALRRARRGIGMIFQQFNLLQNASVFDNVAFPLKIHGGSDREVRAARVRECLAAVDLSDKIDSHPAQLSGGQKQRVAIARALASRPALLLCDEPTSALDSETTRSLLATLRRINEQMGVTILIVTHELSVVSALCRRVAVIEAGRLAETFALDDTAAPRRTALGWELAKLLASAAPANDREALRA